MKLNPFAPSLDTLEKRVRSTKAELESARVHAKAPRQVHPEDPSFCDPDIIAAERAVHHAEAVQAFNDAAPDRLAQKTFLERELRACREVLALTEAEQALPVLKALTVEALDAYASSVQQRLQAKEDNADRRSLAQRRLAAAIEAYKVGGQLIQETRKANGLPLPALAVSANLGTEMNALQAHAARGGATVDMIDRISAGMASAYEDGALNAARIALREVQQKKDRLEAAVERKRLEAEQAKRDHQRARSAGIIG